MKLDKSSRGHKDYEKFFKGFKKIIFSALGIEKSTSGVFKVLLLGDAFLGNTFNGENSHFQTVDIFSELGDFMLQWSAAEPQDDVR